MSICAMLRHQQGNQKLTLATTSGGFHPKSTLTTTWVNFHFNWIKRSTRFIISAIKCFDLLPQVHHKVQTISHSNFFPLAEKAPHILPRASQ